MQRLMYSVLNECIEAQIFTLDSKSRHVLINTNRYELNKKIIA